ncbi:hypothetical protein HYDPIDRAFT_185116 [Hydnomerulius pinastri MD-312]|nr:hypothetical protein HYDPIDRAFT_185109 [Hydnomerulius pinastri MD-312]KIJ69281.1 hypothetical protein HYDPIDRAFT_185116 [Hydnomerulius pinastri MD-312]
MKFSLASLGCFVAVVAAQGILVINTPANVVECEPTLITWSGGEAPYFLVVLPAGQPDAAPIENLGEQTGHSLTWVANVAAGTDLGLTLKDSTGAIAQSAPFTVQPSTSAKPVEGSSGATSSRD